MARYRLHFGALEDLDVIWTYLAQQASVSVANRIEDEFFETFALLSTQPDMGFTRPRLSTRPLRFWILREYLIAYARLPQSLLILAVIHGKRHPRIMAKILRDRH